MTEIEKLRKIQSILSEVIAEKDGGSSEESDNGSLMAEFPSLKEIEKMKKKEMIEVLTKLNFSVKKVKEAVLRNYLKVLERIALGDVDFKKSEASVLRELVIAAGMRPGTVKVNVQKLADFLAPELDESDDEESDDDDESDSDEESDEESDEDDEEEDDEEADDDEDDESDDEDDDESEDDEEEESEDDDDEESDEEEEDEDSEDEEDDDEDDGEEEDDGDEDSISAKRASVVKKKLKKFPSTSEAVKRITAYNKHTKDKLPLKGNAKKIYPALAEKLVDDDDQIAEWGEPYVRDGEGFCCGHAMDEVPSNKKEQIGKCLVTKQKFIYDEDEEKFKAYKK